MECTVCPSIKFYWNWAMLISVREVWVLPPSYSWDEWIQQRPLIPHQSISCQSLGRNTSQPWGWLTKLKHQRRAPALLNKEQPLPKCLFSLSRTYHPFQNWGKCMWLVEGPRLSCKGGWNLNILPHLPGLKVGKDKCRRESLTERQRNHTEQTQTLWLDPVSTIQMSWTSLSIALTPGFHLICLVKGINRCQYLLGARFYLCTAIF